VRDGRRFIGAHRKTIRERHLQILNGQELECARLVACAASTFTSGEQRKEDSFYKFELSQGKFSRTSFPSMSHRKSTGYDHLQYQTTIRSLYCFLVISCTTPLQLIAVPLQTAWFSELRLPPPTYSNHFSAPNYQRLVTHDHDWRLPPSHPQHGTRNAIPRFSARKAVKGASDSSRYLHSRAHCRRPGRLGFAMDGEVLEVVEEVALQRPCLAVVGAAGMLAWISAEYGRA